MIITIPRDVYVFESLTPKVFARRDERKKKKNVNLS